MKFDVLHNFISPVTGRILCDPTYVLVGDSNGIAMPSPILSNILDASFVIGFPNASLPNAQVLDSLANGYIYNTAGTVSTTPTVIPFLTEGYLWIGDATNTPTEYRTITIDNLPDLGQTIVPDPIGGGFVGQIWEGNNLGRPEISNRLGAMFADLAAINARFVTARFVLNDGSAALQLLMPYSQFLSNLVPVNGGFAKIQAVTGLFELAAPGEVGNVSGPEPAASVDESLALWNGVTGRNIKDCAITVVGGADMMNINSVHANIVQAKNTVTSDNDMYARNSIGSREFQFFDPAVIRHVALRAPDVIPLDVTWILPATSGNAGQVLTNTDGTQLQWTDSNGNVSGPDPAVSLNESLALWDGNTGRKIKDCVITVVGGQSIKNINSLYVNNLITSTDIFADNQIGARAVSFFDIGFKNSVSFVAPDVIPSDVRWELPATSGNAGQVLTNTDGTQLQWTTTASSDALYIVQAGNVSLPNAQALDQLISAGPGDPRILKADTSGIVALAVEGTDYGNVSGPDFPAVVIPGNVVIWDGAAGRKIADSEFSIAELEALAEEAALSAQESAASAVEASAAAADAAAEAGSAGASATAAAASAAAARAISLFGVRRGEQGATGDTGATGATGLAGAPGAAGVSGKTTLIIDSNINVVGGRIQDIAASPQADYDAINAKWVWDLLNDNVEIKWE